MCAAPVDQQSVARGTRRLLNAGYRLVSRPLENFVADRPRREPALKPANFLRALRPEVVIHCHRANLPPAFTRPAIGEKRQREAIGAARDRDSKKRLVLPAGDLGKRSRKLCKGEWLLSSDTRSTTELFLFVLRSFLDCVCRIGKLSVELCKRHAGVLLLIRTSERHAEL